jgi:hypothetical protein
MELIQRKLITSEIELGYNILNKYDSYIKNLSDFQMNALVLYLQNNIQEVKKEGEVIFCNKMGSYIYNEIIGILSLLFKVTDENDRHIPFPLAYHYLKNKSIEQYVKERLNVK